MKRSDALKKIQELYKLELDNYPRNNPPDVFAENLLGHLEESGMLPPKTQYEPVQSHNGYLSIEDAVFAGIHEWEPETD